MYVCIKIIFHPALKLSVFFRFFDSKLKLWQHKRIFEKCIV